MVDRDNHRIQRFDADGNYETQWGSDGSGDGEFDYPYGVALSDTGQVYVADRNNHRIQRFDADGNYQLQWGGSGSGDGEFSNPYGIAVSGTGQVYVADGHNDRIQRFFDSEAWDHGTNTFVNDSAGPTSVAVGPGDILGSSLTLDASKGLVVGDTTTVNAGGTLSMNGGSLTTSDIVLNSGTFHSRVSHVFPSSCERLINTLDWWSNFESGSWGWSRTVKSLATSWSIFPEGRTSHPMVPVQM